MKRPQRIVEGGQQPEQLSLDLCPPPETAVEIDSQLDLFEDQVYFLGIDWGVNEDIAVIMAQQIELEEDRRFLEMIEAAISSQRL
jgi:hypothetical protein